MTFLKEILLVCVLIGAGTLFAQTDIDFSNLIDSNRIKRHVEVFAHDSLQGRNTGEIGQKKAANYIQNEYRKIKLDSLTDGFTQSFILNPNENKGFLQLNKITLEPIIDFGSFSDLSELKLSSKKVKHFIYTDFIKRKNFNFPVVIISIDSYSKLDINFLKKTKINTIFVLCDDYNPKLFDLNKSLSLVKLNEQRLIYVNSKRVGLVHKFNQLSLVNTERTEIVTENMIGYISGSDSILKNEFIVVSAHYDHLGVKNGKVFNGADDNASGTAALLEIARVYKEASLSNMQGKRSILFICFTGEEHGLLGSEFYSNNPLVPLKNTVADFNIDMIGRKNEETERDKFSVFAIGSDKISLDFHKIHEQTAKRFGKLTIDYTYNDPKNKERLYYRSDHYNFAKNGIPSIFYFGGFHEDYHKVTDDIEKLNFTKIKTISELVFLTMWQVLNL